MPLKVISLQTGKTKRTVADRADAGLKAGEATMDPQIEQYDAVRKVVRAIPVKPVRTVLAELEARIVALEALVLGRKEG